MIVDIHRHLVAREWFSEGFWRGFARMIRRELENAGLPATIESVIDDVFPLYFDIEGERHLAQMQAAGIDKTAVFLFDVGLIAGEPEVPIEEQNRVVFRVAERYPDRIIPFVHVDPRRPGAVGFVKECVEEHGAKGLKLHPGAGFDPSGRETLDLVGAVSGYGIPLIVHTGASIPPTSSRYSDPTCLDDILIRFPEVNVIAAHLSYGHRQQLFALGWQRPNLFADVSAWQPVARADYPRFARVLREAADSFGPDRILFGTDSPYLWPQMSEADYVQAVKDLPSRAPEDVNFTDTDVAMILGGNAQKLLHL